MDRLDLILSNFTDSGKLIMQMILEEVKIDLDHIHIVDNLQINRENKLNVLFNGENKFDRVNYSFKLSPNEIEDIKANSKVAGIGEKIIFNYLKGKLKDLKYSNLYFTPGFISVIIDGVEFMINFYLYIDLYETKEV